MPTRRHSLLRCFPLLVCLLAAATASPSSAEDIERKIDAFAKKILKCRQIVGISMAVVSGKTTLMAKGYGLGDRATGKPVTGSTLSGIASLTKAFAATLLTKLLSHSSLSLDTPLRHVLGADFSFNDCERTRRATVRDLLAHRLGVPSHNYARMQEGLTRKKLASKIRFLEAEKEFRNSFVYSNLMYGLATYVSEEMTGMSWEDLLQEHIFNPLNMTSTTFTHVANLSRPDIAKPYLPYGTSWKPVSLLLHKYWGELGGSGSILSTAEDMAKWLLFQLGEGPLGTGEVLSRTSLDETHRPVSVIPDSASSAQFRKPRCPVSYTFGEYALGWRRGYYRGWPMILHTGTSWGYGGLATLIPDRSIAIYTGITGRDSGYRGRRLLHMYAVDLLLGVEPWLNLSTACSFLPDSRTRPRKKPATPLRILSLSDYTGTYGNFGYGNLTVEVDNSGLILRYGVIGKWSLEPTGRGKTFRGKPIGLVPLTLPVVTFDQDSTGIVQRLQIPMFNPVNPPVFVRGLKESDAPPPASCPDDPTSTGSDSSGHSELACLLWLASVWLMSG